MKERRYFAYYDESGTIAKIYALYDKAETKSLKRIEIDYRKKRSLYERGILFLHLLNVCDKHDIITFAEPDNETAFENLRSYLRKHGLSLLKTYNGEEILACLGKRQVCDCSKCLRFMTCKTNIHKMPIQAKEGLR